MSNDEGNDYICVNCGNPVKSLFKRYSPTVLKLCNCEHCGIVADKYLEYDIVIIIIDLILFSKEAYRHVLYNTQYRGHVKLALLQLMVVSFYEWVYRNNLTNSADADKFYEATLYLIGLATLIGKFLFFIIILLFIHFYFRWKLKETLTVSNLLKICEALVVAGFGYFLLLTILIWDDFLREINLTFITTYILLSQIQALTVTTPVSRPLLALICTFAGAADRLFLSYLKWIFGV